MEQEMWYIFKIYQEKSFSRAAEKLFLTQSALSMAVQRVEQRLGQPIFDRSTRPLSLTDAGEIYLHTAREAWLLDRELETRLTDLKNLETGTVTLGGTHYVNAYVLPDLLVKYSKRYPGIEVKLMEAGSSFLLEQLEQRQIELTFSCDAEAKARFRNYPAFQDRVLLVVPQDAPFNRLFQDRALRSAQVAAGEHLKPSVKPVPLEPCAGLEFILLREGNNLRRRGMAMLEQAGVTPRIRMELSQMVTAYHLAAAGLGATFLSDRLVRDLPDRLWYYKLDSPLATRDFSLLLANRSYISRAVQAWIDLCAETGL